jgi:HEAT repeat protein
MTAGSEHLPDAADLIDLRRQVVLAGHAGDVDTATRAVVHPDPQTRCLALGALERAAALDDRQLLTALADPHPAVRRRAVTLAARRRHLDLLELLDDPDPSVVEVAAWACGEHEQVSDEVLLALHELTANSPHPLVREAAVAALGAIARPESLPTVLAACADKPAIRRRAVLALAPYDGPEVDGALKAALVDRDWQVRQAAEDLLRADG